MITPVLFSLLIPLQLYAGTEDSGESGTEEDATESQTEFDDAADSPSSAGTETGNTEEAKRHFEEGKRLFDENKFIEAADAFRRAYAERSTWKLLHNIAQAEASAKRYGPAMEAFEKYMALGGDDIPTTRAEMIIAEMKRLRELLGSFELQGEVPDGSIVRVDGVDRGTAPLKGSVRIASGVPHSVMVLHGETVVYEREVQVGSGEHMVLDVTPVSDDPSPPPAEASSPEFSSWESGGAGRRILIGLGAGLTIALAGAGMAFALIANSKYDDFNALKAQVDEDDPDLQKAKSQTMRYDNLTIGMFVGAGVAAAATISLIVVHVAKKKKLEKATSVHSALRLGLGQFELVAPGILVVRF
ncbi:MAG: hypothetical protein JXX29_22995 [Deltaproteobacteria bacterium]|nr:hypothetical protein [Deltaproteobacteria bacterium]MBN2674567.1 hypothetical protein [Deltaproteobacteria bacterium]